MLSSRYAAHRGYALILVLVLGIVLASLTGMLLSATGRTDLELRVQENNTKAMYAAEGAVSIGIEKVLLALRTDPQPDLSPFDANAPVMAGATLPTFRIRYWDEATNASSSLPPSAPFFGVIPAPSPNAGLFAAQSPIQILVTAKVGSSLATLADAVRVDLIPIFQFAIFTDGDFELQSPATMNIAGRVHANGDMYFSNGSAAASFAGIVTAAGHIANHASFTTANSVGTGTATTKFGGTALQPTATVVMPYAGTATASHPAVNDLNQAAYLSVFAGNLSDHSTGALPLAVPITVQGQTVCNTNASCTAGSSCRRAMVTDPTGFCTTRITSRPDICGNGSSTSATATLADKSRDNFAQALGINVIQRPSNMYTGGVYNVTGLPARSTTIYGVDFGPTFTGVDVLETAPGRVSSAPATLGFEDQVINRKVPVIAPLQAADDAGARDQRLFWQAHILIIDGIWYKQGASGAAPVPVFNPETWNMAAGPLDFDDAQTALGHKFARVLRYSWFWDPRETRVYTGANPYQRGAQIRSTDFDVAAFNALLEDAQARALLFPPGGNIPPQGVIVYLSETYDPSFEDPNTNAPRSPNVRNFLNFHYLENAPINTRFVDATTKVFTLNSLATTVLPGYSPAPLPATLFSFTPATPTAAIKRPDELGWFPENIWGKNTPRITGSANFFSLTHGQTALNGLSQPKVTPSLAGSTGMAASPTAPPNNPDALVQFAGVNDGCEEPASVVTPRVPATRPTPAQRASGLFRAPCIQSGATPLGPENAVRVVRAQTVIPQGLTVVSDNRMYILGDVNVSLADGSSGADVGVGRVIASASGPVQSYRDVPGRVSFMADSVTLLSSRFSDRTMQRGGDPAATPPTAYATRARFSGGSVRPKDLLVSAPYEPVVAGVLEINGTNNAAGAMPNLCTLSRTDIPNAFAASTLNSGIEVFAGADPRSFRTALPTRYNASFLMGDVPACINAGNNLGNPSGGLNNFPRFLEVWNGTTNVINGSLVSLFRSERGNARFLDSAYGQNDGGTGIVGARQTGAAIYTWTSNPCVYSPPTRVWAFDPSLQNPANLPPGTPRVFADQNMRWVRR